MNVQNLQNAPSKSAFIYISNGTRSILDNNYAGNQALHFNLDHLSERLPAAILLTSKQTNSRDLGLPPRSSRKLLSSGVFCSD